MKKNKIFKLLTVVLILLCAVSILFACGEDDSDKPNSNTDNTNKTPVITEIKVTFMDGDEILKETSEAKEALSYEPEKEGYLFDGWFLDEDLTEEITKTPTKSVTLYAKWVKATFRVTFLDGEGQPILVDGESYQMVEYGESAKEPDAPELEGYVFSGWNMDFSEVKSNLTIRALYDTEKKSIILYGEDGKVIKEQEVMVGEDITLYFNSMFELAGSSLPGGLSLVNLYTDSELQNEYEIPSGKHVMPTKDIHLYTKARLQDIEGLELTPSRNNFRYDTNGFSVASSLYKNSVVTYAYEWYEVAENKMPINGEVGTSLVVGCKDVGEYTYEVKVTATYKNLTPVVATESITITVTPGTLEGLITVQGFEDTYDGSVRELIFTGTKAGDVISYKLANEALYSTISPIKNSQVYMVESKVERKNYEPLEFDAVRVTINKKLLTPRLWMRDGNNIVTEKIIEYGDSEDLAYVWYDFDGFVGEDNKDNAFDNAPAQVLGYSAGSPTGMYFPTISLENCYAQDGTKPQNYTFGDIEEELLLIVNKRKLTLTFSDVTLTYGDEKPSEFACQVTNAFDADLTRIQDTVNLLVTCDYQKGSAVTTTGYDVTVDGTQVASALNNSYQVTVNDAKILVNKASVTVTPTSFSVIYGEDAPSYDFEAKGLVNGENKSVLGTPVYVCDYAKGMGVVNGGYTISFNVNSLSNSNYNISFKTGILAVNPKAVTLTLADHSITYFETAPENDAFYNLLSQEGTIDGEDLANIATSGFTFEVEGYNQGSDVGEYKVRVDFESSVNYIVNGKETVYGNLEVVKKALTISVVSSEVIYGNAVDVNVSYDGLVGEELWEPTLAVSGGEIVGGYEVGYAVGTYTIEIGNYESTNYAISYVPGDITVVERKLILKARAYTDDEVVWSGDMQATDGSVAYAGDGIYENDTISGIINTTAGTQGAYIASGSEIGEKFIWTEDLKIERDGESTISNYMITYDFQVAIATYGVFVYANEVIYDGLAHGLDVDHIFETPIATVLYSEDGVTYSEDAKVYTQAGNYAVYYSIRVYDANGEIEKEVKDKLTVAIAPRPIYFVVDPKTITYGETIPDLTYVVNPYESGKDVYANGEDLSTLGAFNIEAVDLTSNAGRYDVIISGLANDNYAINVTNSMLIINQAPLTVTASSHSITYGDAVPSFSAVCEGFVNGETLETLGTNVKISSTYETVSNRKSGEFQVVPSLSLLNYKVIAINGVLSVEKMAITLSADTKNVYYGDATPVLSATANKLATANGHSDTVSDIGTVAMSTSYISGNNVGQYDIVFTSVISEKYDVTLVESVVIVSPYKAVVNWVGTSATYTYDGVDHTSEISASYVDFYGVTQNATISFVSNNASSTTPNNFQNAGNYTTTATTADTNYELVNSDMKSAVITLTMIKARYENITHSAFSGVYNKDVTLNSGYALNENFRWSLGTVVPTVDVITYLAYYNADSENYFDYDINISVELTPAIVSIQTDSTMSGSVENGYDVTASINTSATNLVAQTYTLSPVIYWNDGNTAISDGFTLTYSNGTQFIGGTHLTAMTFSSINYKIESTLTNTNNYLNTTIVNWFIKYKSVDVGGTLYTPEDAINTATSGNIIVKSNTTFASQQEVVERYYNSSSYYTVKSGVTFLVPYKADDTLGYLPGATQGDSSGNYEQHPNKTNGDSVTPILYLTLGIPQITTLNVNGSFVVGAKTGVQDAGTLQNAITGNYSVVNLVGTIVANSATVKVYGYVLGNGTIVANSTTVTENLYLSGWMGGTQSVAKYVGNQSLDAWPFLESGEVTINNEYAFPFNQYELRSIQSNLVINYGSKLNGWLKIATGARSYAGLVNIDAMITEAVIVFVSSDASDESSGVIRLLDESAKITKSFANDRVKLAMDGNVADGYCALISKVLKATVNMRSKNIFFPIDGRTDIVINSGATFTQKYKFKLLPGATLTVAEGATYNVNSGGQLIAYTKDFVDNETYPYPSAERGDAKITINGTMNLNGAFGGYLYSSGTGRVVVGSGATLSVTSNETTNSGTTMDVQVNLVYNAKVVFTIGTTNTPTKQAVLANASGSLLAVAGTTYTYNGTAWA